MTTITNNNVIPNIIQGCVVLAVAALCGIVWNLQINVAVLANTVGNLESAVRFDTNDRYTRKEAKEAWDRQEEWNKITDRSIDFLEMEQDEFDKRLYLRENKK